VSYELIGIIVTIAIQCMFFAYKMGRFEQKLTDIVQKQDKHNNLMERTFKIETAIGVLQEKVNVENHRIEDLEDVQNKCRFRNKE
jgi:peptidoglycan hydrolase CwlO-like protein